MKNVCRIVHQRGANFVVLPHRKIALRKGLQLEEQTHNPPAPTNYLDVVAYAYTPRTWEAEAGGLLQVGGYIMNIRIRLGYSLHHPNKRKKEKEVIETQKEKKHDLKDDVGPKKLC